MLKRAQSAATGLLVGIGIGWLVIHALIPYIPALMIVVLLLWVVRIIMRDPG